jgi:hypothetical protein
MCDLVAVNNPSNIVLPMTILLQKVSNVIDLVSKTAGLSLP